MPTKVMIIRHAEKPLKDGKAQGVTVDGEPSEGSLTVRGWQRAGALAHLLAPSNKTFADPRLEQPTVIYASNSSGGSKRPLQTVRPLARKINVDPVETFTKAGEVELVAAVRKEAGVVLVCWQHERIVDISERLTEKGPALTIPDTWPDERFDVVWIFTPSGGDGGLWGFAQVPQQLLAGDASDAIGSSPPGGQ